MVAIANNNKNTEQHILMTCNEQVSQFVSFMVDAGYDGPDALSLSILVIIVIIS